LVDWSLLSVASVEKLIEVGEGDVEGETV